MDPFKAINEKTHHKSAHAQVESTEFAESIALKALQHLATSEENLQRFSALSGCQPQDFRQLASEPSFFVAIMDYFLNHEPDLLALCANQAISPEEFAKARERLNGTTQQTDFE